MRAIRQYRIQERKKTRKLKKHSFDYKLRNYLFLGLATIFTIFPPQVKTNKFFDYIIRYPDNSLERKVSIVEPDYIIREFGNNINEYMFLDKDKNEVYIDVKNKRGFGNRDMLSPSMKQEASWKKLFLKKMNVYLKDIDLKGVPPEVVIAVAAHETQWGKYSPYNNLYGAKDWSGNGALLKTREYDGKSLKPVLRAFEIYESEIASIKHFLDFKIVQNSKNSDPIKMVEEMWRKGYTENNNPAWKNGVIRTIYGLNQPEAKEMLLAKL